VRSEIDINYRRWISTLRLYSLRERAANFFCLAGNFPRLAGISSDGCSEGHLFLGLPTDHCAKDTLVAGGVGAAGTCHDGGLDHGADRPTSAATAEGQMEAPSRASGDTEPERAAELTIAVATFTITLRAASKIYSGSPSDRCAVRSRSPLISPPTPPSRNGLLVIADAAGFVADSCHIGFFWNRIGATGSWEIVAY
jgi:hypothetical protein